MTPADEEVTPTLAETIAAFLKPAEPRSDGVFYLRDADALAANLAAVLESVFVLVPKDQLHQEWTGESFFLRNGPDAKVKPELIADSRELAESWRCGNERILSRWVGSWRPENEEQQ